MNWNRISGNWDHFKPLLKHRWDKLDDQQLRLIAGNRDKLIGKIVEAYGFSEGESDAQLSAWQDSQDWQPPVQ